MSKIFSTKTLLASSTIAFGLLAVLGSAQAQQFKASKPSLAASRQIEVLPGDAGAQRPQTEQRADASAANTDGPPDENVADASAAQQDAPPADAEPAATQSGTSGAEPKIIATEETKRLNRQRYTERYEARYTEQRYAEPRYHERYAQPRYEQRYAEQRYVEPRYVQREAYVQRYQAAPNYGYVQQRRTAEHCAPSRGY